MKNRISIYTAIALIFTAITSSCLGDTPEPENKASLTYGPVFNTITNTATGEVYYNNEIDYQLILDYVHATFGLSQTDLKLNNSFQKHTIQINDIPYTLDKTTLTATSSSPVAITAPTSLNISNVLFKLTDRVINNNYNPLIQLTYTVNSNYEVVVTPVTCVFFGKLTSKNLATNESFTVTNVRTNVIFNPETGVASIDLKGIKFVEAMPALDMTFPGIGFDITTTGFTLASDMLTPTIKDVPYPNYPISKLGATATLATGKMALKFNCTPRGMSEYEITLECEPVPAE